MLWPKPTMSYPHALSTCPIHFPSCCPACRLYQLSITTTTYCSRSSAVAPRAPGGKPSGGMGSSRRSSAGRQRTDSSASGGSQAHDGLGRRRWAGGAYYQWVRILYWWASHVSVLRVVLEVRKTVVWVASSKSLCAEGTARNTTVGKWLCSCGFCVKTWRWQNMYLVMGKRETKV